MTRPGVQCPRCDSPRLERLAVYGSQLMTSQYRCASCGELFEVVRRTDAGSGVDGGVRAPDARDGSG